MPEFFPRHTAAWRTEKPAPLRRLSISLPQMALVTGVALRLWRSYAMTHGSPESGLWVGGTLLAAAAFLCLMCAIHLANFTLKNWVWRAPAFAVVEAGTEIVMSLALTTVGMEPLGASMGELSDWFSTATKILFLRLVGVSLFALILGMVVSVLRRLLLAAEDRTHTAAAIHRASVEQEAATTGSHATPS